MTKGAYPLLGKVPGFQQVRTATEVRLRLPRHTAAVSGMRDGAWRCQRTHPTRMTFHLRIGWIRVHPHHLRFKLSFVPSRPFAI